MASIKLITESGSLVVVQKNMISEGVYPILNFDVYYIEVRLKGVRYVLNKYTSNSSALYFHVMF